MELYPDMWMAHLIMHVVHNVMCTICFWVSLHKKNHNKYFLISFNFLCIKMPEIQCTLLTALLWTLLTKYFQLSGCMQVYPYKVLTDQNYCYFNTVESC